MDTARRVTELREQGFTLIEGLLSSAEIARTRAELAPYLEKRHMGRNEFEGLCSERVYALLAKAPSVAGIVEHPATLAIVDALLPKNYLLSANLAINVHPGETPQDFHRDDVGASFLPMPRPLLGVSTMWAYDDFTADNGATEVVPGSHLAGAARSGGRQGDDASGFRRGVRREPLSPRRSEPRDGEEDQKGEVQIFKHWEPVGCVISRTYVSGMVRASTHATAPPRSGPRPGRG